MTSDLLALIIVFNVTEFTRLFEYVRDGVIYLILAFTDLTHFLLECLQSAKYHCVQLALVIIVPDLIMKLPLDITQGHLFLEGYFTLLYFGCDLGAA